MSNPYKTREGGATVTVFVPYDCNNHCPYKGRHCPSRAWLEQQGWQTEEQPVRTLTVQLSLAGQEDYLALQCSTNAGQNRCRDAAAGR